MKVSSKVYKGIEYVQISELPEIQRVKLLQTIDQDVLIKILIDRKIISNCLQYKDYELWFDNIYKPGQVSQAKIAEKQTQITATEPVLDNA
jgi:hypothetical protein